MVQELGNKKQLPTGNPTSVLKHEQRYPHHLWFLSPLSSQPPNLVRLHGGKIMRFQNCLSLLEDHFPSHFNIASTALSFLRIHKSHLFLLTSSAWGKLSSLLTLFQRFLKTNHKQISLAPPLKTSVFHMDECSVRRKQGSIMKMHIIHLK